MRQGQISVGGCLAKGKGESPTTQSVEHFEVLEPFSGLPWAIANSNCGQSIIFASSSTTNPI
jgi:hypothetical protein